MSYIGNIIMVWFEIIHQSLLDHFVKFGNFLKENKDWIEIFMPLIQIVIGSIVTAFGAILGVSFLVRQQKATVTAQKSVEYFERNIPFYNEVSKKMNSIIDNQNISLQDRNDLLVILDSNEDKLLFCGKSLSKELKSLHGLVMSFNEQTDRKMTKKILEVVEKTNTRLNLILKPFVFR